MLFTKKASMPKKSSAFSEFIRNASAAEKKRFYSEVMREAIERQKKVMEAARAKEEADSKTSPISR